MISFFIAVFTSWILSRILCVLAESECSLLHEKSVSAILSLLQVRLWFVSTFSQTFCMDFSHLSPCYSIVACLDLCNSGTTESSF